MIITITMMTMITDAGDDHYDNMIAMMLIMIKIIMELQ